MVLRLLERNRTCFVFVSEDQPFGSSCKFHEITPWDIYIFDIWCKYMWHARQKYAVDLAELSQIARCVRPPDESITGFVFRRIYHRFCRLFNRPQRWDGKFWSTVLSVCLCHFKSQIVLGVYWNIMKSHRCDPNRHDICQISHTTIFFSQNIHKIAINCQCSSL